MTKVHCFRNIARREEAFRKMAMKTMEDKSGRIYPSQKKIIKDGVRHRFIIVPVTMSTEALMGIGPGELDITDILLALEECRAWITAEKARMEKKGITRKGLK